MNTDDPGERDVRFGMTVMGALVIAVIVFGIIESVS
jgi:hypothetical protein